MNISLSLTDIGALSPLLILLFGSLIVLLIESFNEAASKKHASLVTLLTIAIAAYAAVVAPVSDNPLLTPWLKFDGLARFFTFFFLAIGYCTALLSISFFSRFSATQGEYYFLLLASLFGLILIGSAADFLTLFLGLETLSIALYILCGYMKKWEYSHESAVKYFIMGSISAAFLLYGIALIYGAVGSNRFDLLLPAASQDHMLFLSGIVFVTLGLAFKATVVPFHFWAPDVYDGAPTPVTAFMAVGTKVGAFAALARLFLVALPNFDPWWNEGIALLAYPTLIYGNILALRQAQLRRFFAYSGISHAGFLLIPLAAGTPDALTALLFYLVIYATATLGCFAVLAALDHHSEGVWLADLRGLFRRAPVLALFLTICLLTLAGIPPTAGFFGKFYLFKVAFQSGYYGLVFIGLLTAILSAYYYLRIIAVMFAEAPEELGKPTRSRSVLVMGTFSLIAILFLSCYPAPLLYLLQSL